MGTIVRNAPSNLIYFWVKKWFYSGVGTALLEMFQRLHFSAIATNDPSKSLSLSLSISLLQCFKSIKESTPHTELPLNLCNVIYVPKEGRKKRHELRFSLPGGEALVLAVQSKEQAQRWLKVPLFIIPKGWCWVRQQQGKTQGNVAEARTQDCLEVKVFFLCDQVVQDVGSQCGNTEGLDGSTSPIIQRKLELDKVWVCFRTCLFINSIFFVFLLCIPKPLMNFLIFLSR